jgi:hypothetical protein
MTRAEHGRCPGRTDGQHDWIEITTLQDVGMIERYACGYCPAKAEEVTEQGKACGHLAGGE